jgi:PAS domain S-box-containing protein
MDNQEIKLNFFAESGMHFTRDQLNIILQGISDGVTIQDPQGNFVFANYTAAVMLGLPNEEALLNLPVSEVTKRFEIMDEQGHPLPIEKLPSRAALRGEGSSQAVIRYRVRSTGEERWSSLRSIPVTTEDGQVDLVVNLFQDITEFKRIEQSRYLLEQAGNLLSSSLEISEIGISVAHLAVVHLSDWCALYLVEEGTSPKLAAVAHSDPEKVRLAHELYAKYPPDWEASGGVAGVLRSGKPEFVPQVTLEMITARAKDEEHFRIITALGLRSVMTLPLIARGRVIGALALVWAESGRTYSPNDIALGEELARLSALAIDNAHLYRRVQETNADLEARISKRTTQLQTTIQLLRNEIGERKKAEAALRESETMLESLFESAPDATILVDSEGKIVMANQQAEIVFGYSKEALADMILEDLLPRRYHGNHSAHRLAYITEKTRRPMGLGLELYGLRKDGREFPLDIMLSPVDTNRGPLVICAIRDITERKEMEAELSEVQFRLIESVEAERLNIAQELHDGPIQDLYGINFYLNSIASLVKPEDAQPLEETKELVTQIVQTLRTMCSELRPPSLAPFGLEKAILAHLEKVTESQPDMKIALNLKPDNQLLPERTRLALFRIYQHAVSNVLRHAEATRLDVNLDFDDKELVLEIRDNGRGFNLPARWVDLARKGHLGLVGTAERAEAIGARLKIDAAPGIGTSIQIHLPLGREDHPPYRRAWSAPI